MIVKRSVMESCLTQGGKDAVNSLLMLENGPETDEHDIDLPLDFGLEALEWKAFISKFKSATSYSKQVKSFLIWYLQR